MIQVDTPGYYTISAKNSKIVESIKNGEIYDNVFRGRNNCYTYYVADPNNDVKIKMKVYSGDPDLYVHPKILPQMLHDFKYNSLETMESEELVLTTKMREDDDNIVGSYYICVLGKHTSSFKIEIKNKENSDYMLESGLSETGYLEKDETINYWYREDILKETTNITVQLHAMTGSQTLRTKRCQSTDNIDSAKEQCMHTKEDLLKPIPDEPTFTNIGKEFIVHDPEGCNDKGSIFNILRTMPPSCMYNIGVIGMSTGKSHYAVTVRHQEGHHQLLSEGRTVEGSLIQSQYDYYKISINDDTITSFTIQLLTIHGDPDMFISKVDDFPTKDKFERKSTICGRYPDTIVFTVNPQNGETDLVGDYHIGVFGFVESSYHIYYHTERTYTDDDDNTKIIKLPIKLSQNTPVRGVLKTPDDYAKYKFTIANVTNEEEIIIQLTPQNGKFKFAVKHDGEATKTDFDKEGSINGHYTVAFNPVKEPEFKEGEFNIYVYPQDTDDLKKSGMSYTFLMNYFIGSHHIYLLNDQPTVGFLSDKDKIGYYSYAFRAETDEIKLTVTKVTGNVEAIISLNQEISFPTRNDVNDENGVYSTKYEKNTIPSSMIRKSCKHGEYGYCKMTVAIYPTESGKDSQYILTAKAIRKETTPISKVENGVPQHGSAKANEWQYYYFKTSSAEPITAVIVPNGGDPNIFVSLVTDLTLKESEWDRPTEATHLKKSEDTFGADILMLTKTDLEK